MSAFSSTMAHSDFRSFLSKCVFLTLLIALSAAREICDKSKCPGPLSYYANLECKPIYKNPGDCCAEAFDCSHLEKLSKNKCYVNGHEYSIGENLREEDANPCDVGCVCAEGFENQAAFTCAVVDCFFPPPKEGCFNRHYANQCCSSETICLEQSEKRATCEVDGKLYYDGEYFTPKSDPDLNCNCLPGYTGENVEPFCKKPNRPYCLPVFRNAYEIQQKCAPVFYSSQSPQTDCSVFSRCQNSDDIVIHNHDAKSVSESDDSKVCVFGNMTMHIGDTLSKGNSYESVCVNCKCEVPPTPTCIQENDCDYSEVAKSLTDTTADLSCKNTEQTVGVIYTRTNFVTLQYVTDSWGTKGNGFRLVITAVKDPKHTCKDFRCTEKEFCIEQDLLCDGVNHCGDGSDESIAKLCANSEASTILGMQPIWFAVALVLLILSVAGMVTATVLCFWRQRVVTPRHPHNAHNAQNHPPVSFPLQQMYESNGASAGLPVGMTTLKGSTGTLGILGSYGSGYRPGITEATTLPRPGNWLRPAGLRLGHSAARVRLYCQAK